MPTNILAGLIVIFTIYSGILYFFITPHLSKFSAGLLMIASLSLLILIGLHGYSQHNLTGFERWYFNFSYGEFNPGATFSSTQLAITAWFALLLAWLSKRSDIWHRFYFTLLAIVFFFLALDEYFLFHENINNWKLIYLVAGIFIAFISLVIYWFGYKRREIWLFLMLFGGMGISVAGAMLLEIFAARDCYGIIRAYECSNIAIVEESLEFIGITIVLAGFLIYAERNMRIVFLRRSAWLTILFSMVWGFALFASFWIIPPAEARTLATDINIAYEDNALSIIGYRLSNKSLRPHDTLTVTLYWRANRQLPDYGYSLHLVDTVAGESVAGVNEVIEVPATSAWRAGHVHRTTAYLRLPADITTPQSYALTLSVWNDDGADYPLQNISYSDQPLLTSESVILAEMPVISRSGDIADLPEQDYHFAAGLSISGYALLPPENQQLAIRVGWRAKQSITQEFVQFWHFFHDESDYVHIFDRPPFGERFPTYTWVEGITEVDMFTIPLPDHMPEGSYRVYTGLYEADTLERNPVTDANGQPAQNHAIFIDTITIESPST